MHPGAGGQEDEVPPHHPPGPRPPQHQAVGVHGEELVLQPQQQRRAGETDTAVRPSATARTIAPAASGPRPSPSASTQVVGAPGG